MWPSCFQDSRSLPLASQNALSISRVPVSQSPLTGVVSVGYKIVITETNGGSGELLFVSSQIYDPETGQQVALNYFDGADLIVFVGTKKVEPLATLEVAQTLSYVLPDFRTAAQLTVNVQMKDEQRVDG